MVGGDSERWADCLAGPTMPRRRITPSRGRVARATRTGLPGGLLTNGSTRYSATAEGASPPRLRVAHRQPRPNPSARQNHAARLASTPAATLPIARPARRATTRPGRPTPASTSNTPHLPTAARPGAARRRSPTRRPIPTSLGLTRSAQAPPGVIAFTTEPIPFAVRESGAAGWLARIQRDHSPT